MKLLKRKLSSLMLVSVLVIAIFTLFFAASISYKQIQIATGSERLVVHSYKVYVELEQLNLFEKDAESGQRGFLLTRDSSLLDPYNIALGKIKRSLDKLKSLVLQDKVQKENLDSLTLLINRRHTLLGDVLKNVDFRANNYDSIKNLIEKGTQTMMRAQILIDKMVYYELQTLKSREMEHEDDIKISPFSILFIVLFSLTIFILSFLKINNDLKGLAQTNNQLMIKDKLIEEKIADLERSNKQLSAFNHIASHDLQEPLRKVQIFVSRIRDSGLVKEKIKEYFSGIEKEAARMQKFIEDLLVYSRANKIDKNFEPTDLNEILDNALHDLSQRIEEKNAVIRSVSKLPVVNAIPFQMQQLFINLISNSIKYSKSDTSPVIEIKSEIVKGIDIQLINSETSVSYYEISFSDNGIGFEQKYAENIFTLFYRLHNTNQYSGTGIGLAICKIIVENHKGYILAEGVPDKGSTFKVFLPV